MSRASLVCIAVPTNRKPAAVSCQSLCFCLSRFTECTGCSSRAFRFRLLFCRLSSPSSPGDLLSNLCERGRARCQGRNDFDVAQQLCAARAQRGCLCELVASLFFVCVWICAPFLAVPARTLQMRHLLFVATGIWCVRGRQRPSKLERRASFFCSFIFSFNSTLNKYFAL